MNDAEIYLKILRLVKAYNLARIVNNNQLAYEISVELANEAQALSDMALEIQKIGV
jgi:hypothetical protein